MKQFLSLILIGVLTGCGAAAQSSCKELSPRFKYRQKVVIASGFYRGTIAEIILAREFYRRFDDKCLVQGYEVSTDDEHHLQMTFEESELTAVTSE